MSLSLHASTKLFTKKFSNNLLAVGALKHYVVLALYEASRFGVNFLQYAEKLSLITEKVHSQ